jgi:hypothetical protein
MIINIKQLARSRIIYKLDTNSCICDKEISCILPNSSVMSYISDDLHIQDKMSFAGFRNWSAFKVEDTYGEQWGYFSSQSGCSSFLSSTVVTQVDDQDYSKAISTYNRFTVNRNQQSLFYELVERYGYKQVSSESSSNTHRYNADDSGGYQPGEYKVPKCTTTVFKKKEK